MKKSHVLGRRVSAFCKWYYLSAPVPSRYRFWMLMRRLMPDTRFTLPYGNGGWITVHERDYLQRMIFASGSYEPEVWATLQKFVKQGDILWDIGANVGSFAILAAQDSRIQEVHCFEPHPVTAPVLRMNAALNKGKFCIHEVGLGDQIGEFKLYNGPAGNIGITTFGTNLGYGEYEAKCTTVDSLLSEDNLSIPNVLKIDVEGWEKHIFLGALNLLKTNPPRVMVFEMESTPDGGPTDETITALLSEYQYRIDWIRRPSGVVEQRENYLAFRE